MKDKKNSTILWIILIAVALGGGFFGGTQYDRYQRSQGHQGNRQFMQGPNGPMQGRNGNGRPIVGEVLSKDTLGITVKNQDGGSTIVLLTNSTTYSKTSESTADDIAVGSQVGVFGTANPDKSITAQNVQLNPQFRMTGANGTPESSLKKTR